MIVKEDTCWIFFFISRTLNLFSFYSRSSFNTEFISGVCPFLDLQSWCTSTLSGTPVPHLHQSVNLLPGTSLWGAHKWALLSFNVIEWLEVKSSQPHEEPLFAEQQLMFVLMRGGSSRSWEGWAAPEWFGANLYPSKATESPGQSSPRLRYKKEQPSAKYQSCFACHKEMLHSLFTWTYLTYFKYLFTVLVRVYFVFYFISLRLIKSN